MPRVAFVDFNETAGSMKPALTVRLVRFQTRAPVGTFTFAPTASMTPLRTTIVPGESFVVGSVKTFAAVIASIPGLRGRKPGGRRIGSAACTKLAKLSA